MRAGRSQPATGFVHSRSRTSAGGTADLAVASLTFTALELSVTALPGLATLVPAVMSFGGFALSPASAGESVAMLEPATLTLTPLILLNGIRVEVDWNKDGDFTDLRENVTSRVLTGRSPVMLSYGRSDSTSLSGAASGSGGFELDNQTKDYSPRNSTSPLYGLVKPARPVKVTRTIGGVARVLFIGHTDGSPINPDPSSKSVSLSLLDSLSDFRGINVSTPLYSGIRTGEAVGYVLDACGWPTDKRDLDPGAAILAWWWEEGTDALTALDNLLHSEGPPSLLTIGVDGAIVFRDRHHRIIRAASITSQDTWTPTDGTEPVMAVGFSYDEAWRNVINSGTASMDVRAPQALQQVWTAESTVILTAGEQRVITATTSDPVTGAVAPVEGTDYTLESGTVSVQLLRTSGASIGIVLTADSACILSGLQLRAHPVTVVSSVRVSASDAASIEDYGVRSYPHTVQWGSSYNAEAVLRTTVTQRAQPLPVLTVPFRCGKNTARSEAVLVRDLSDRVTVVEGETELDGDFYIESIQHEFRSEYDHTVTFGLESAPTFPEPLFRLDTLTQGLDEGLLSAGFDDPSMIFLLDDTVGGHGLDESLFAT